MIETTEEAPKTSAWARQKGLGGSTDIIIPKSLDTNQLCLRTLLSNEAYEDHSFVSYAWISGRRGWDSLNSMRKA